VTKKDVESSEVAEEQELPRIGMSITVRPKTKALVEELAVSLNISSSRLADILMMEAYEARKRKGNLYAPLFSKDKDK
jgi:hypothetical protein